jgi:hypothetical protein
MSKTPPQVTRHGRIRLKERVGITSDNDIARFLKNCRSGGKSKAHADMPPEIKKFVNGVAKKNKLTGQQHYRWYKTWIPVFNGQSKLITIYIIPDEVLEKQKQWEHLQELQEL